MKFAVSGKGGTGKTTVSGILAHYFNNDGYQVLAVDADPDANLASAIGIPTEQAACIVPISRQRRLIEEKTGAKPRQFGQLFKLNPAVSDIADQYCLDFQGIKLLVMGGIQKGGSGCACPENVHLKSLLAEIILNRNEVVIVDMEAGIEHLGRATSREIDKMIITVEPGSRSIFTAKTIMKLAKDIGIESFGVVGNKILDEKQKSWISSQFPQDQILGMVSYNEIIREADLTQQPLIEVLDEKLKKEFKEIYQACRSIPPNSQ
ncbi:MAG: AAA family ATPase [Candidatus Aminicenantes bacterium]|nr:MAG: AAA family ATPase [Candidatus Aminicenantes bacterium]